ncbi:hypothetical protein Dsin_010973 [Dipteronia sinensis]|uniref:HMA domain-containing protein n=1 Tax=Dipteronia sinensis TaxID=43782 RepID=A0AAE0ATJ0_9ROSI|nr:hypothetical protein Dsin_010973 [Dipteronia sinensis]
MDSHNIPTTTCALKVKIKCCTICPEKAMKKLKKMDGVDSMSYDADKYMLRVSGNNNLDPMVLINKFAEWGKKAELYSFQTGQGIKNKIQDKKSDDSSSDDHDHIHDHCGGGNFDVHAPMKHRDKNIIWVHPSLVEKNSPVSVSPPPPSPPPPLTESPVNKQSTKKCKGFFGRLFGKKEKEPRKINNKIGGAAANTKWHFPRTAMPMPGYRPPGPYGAAPFHGASPHYMNQYPTMGFPGMIPSPQGYGYGYGSMLSPPPSPLMPPPPYSPFQSRPPPMMNPMIHYTGDYYYP